jgi:hypothetical protein
MKQDASAALFQADMIWSMANGLCRHGDRVDILPMKTHKNLWFKYV